MSAPPEPPGRSELKTSVFRSEDSEGKLSLKVLFKTGPTFTGANQASPTAFRVETHRSCVPIFPAGWKR